MDSSYRRPKLRWPLDIRMHGGAGGPAALVIQCPIGVSEKPLFLAPAVAPLVSLLDGSVTREEIIERFAPQGLTEAILGELVELLDSHLFLANTRFFAAERESRESFEEASVRRAALAGRSYPPEPAKLASMVRGLMATGPGQDPSAIRGEPLCLVAPHIDYGRGGRCYGVTYPHLAGSSASLFVLIGTAHQYSEQLFHLCSKDFVTPMGVARCDTEFVAKLASRYGVARSFAGQFLHKREHSLELQLPFLGATRPGVSIVPVLVGSMHSMVARQRAPRDYDVYESFVAALAECIREHEGAGGRVCIIAGVDMAHVGRSFGDTESLTPERMEVVAQRDQEYLGAIARGDAGRLFAHICEDGDARRICGFPTMHTVLDLFARLGRRTSTELISYDQAVDYPGECAVTFAGMVVRAPAHATGG